MHSFYNKQVIINSNGEICGDSKDITKTELFKEVMHKYLEHLREKDSPLLEIFPRIISQEEQEVVMINLLQKLSEFPKEQIIEASHEFKDFFKDTYLLHQFVENLYNYWRSFERFFVCYSNNDEESSYHKTPYRTFNKTIESLNYNVRKVYRDICEHITNEHCRIYRQMPAGCQVGLIVNKENWLCPPAPYDKLKDINFIRQVLIEPPLIIDPPMNKRDGHFSRIDVNPLEDIQFNCEDWLCYPAKVGPLVIYL